jgi:muramidase (phage lysozyme)
MLETGKQPKPNTPNVLKPNKQYEIAKAISSTGGVWDVADSPWSDYILNNDPESIRGNLDLLQQSIKPETYEDKTAKPKSENNSPTKPAGRAYSGAVGYGEEPIKNTVPNQGNANLSSGVDTSVADDNKKETSNLDRSSADSRPGMMRTNYKGPPASISDPATNALLDFIGQKESNGNYNILVGGKTEPNLTNMTISEVLEYQKTMLRRGHESTAVGKYQIIKKTLLGLVGQGYAKLTDIFNPQTQDKLALGLLKGVGLNRYLSKKISTEKFADNISGIWASLPFKTGKSFHHGVGSNKSSGSRESFVNVVAKLSPGSGDIVNDGYVMPGAVASSRQVDPNGDTNKTTPPTSASTTMAAAQEPVTKSVYNPVARPEMMKVKAAQVSREAAASLNDAGGFNPASLNTGSTIARNNANKNALPSDLMTNTENILAKSLEVQSQTLEVMKKIFEKITKEDATTTSGKVTTADNKKDGTTGGYTYQSPSVPVQYRKSV